MTVLVFLCGWEKIVVGDLEWWGVIGWEMLGSEFGGAGRCRRSNDSHK
jgi:hypothetical protein